MFAHIVSCTLQASLFLVPVFQFDEMTVQVFKQATILSDP